MRYLGFILLIWFPGGLQAQSAAQPCPAPKLVGGYFVHEQETYSHEDHLIYACDNGYKPAVEGWWATSTCHNGTWSHTPQCMDESACIPPTIANAKYTKATGSWYEDGHIIRITCDKGYEHKNRVATARCMNGTWPLLPTCEKSVKTCSEPPKIPHAVIVHRGYEELFPEESVVQYECEDGYSIEASQKNSSMCLAGTWTDGPMCRLGTGRVVEGGVSADVGTGTTSAGHGTQHGDRGSRPDTGSNAEVGTGGGGTTSAGHGTQLGGGGDGGSSTSSNTKPLVVPIYNCGVHPTVAHGDVVQTAPMYLKYKCSAFYTQVGPETVVCYNDDTWSSLPVCKGAFCVMEPAIYGDFELVTAEYLMEGETKNFQCVWPYYYMAARCTNGRISHSRCCREDYHYYRYCSWIQLPPVGPATAD
ncbi:coagulation factor XIII B chain [Scophthalmus maximus]|uniref:coagulation factor XIII B chain n=1 Tax=Scophthalmus maximus TaxID=52904 RepID=UPI001FA8F400|nr:coagulation factor XIII B chain [Scophthalmus maximus]